MNTEKHRWTTDAVIVLANLMDESGALNPESAARAACSAEVLHQREAKYLVTCGWDYREDCDIPIAHAFKDHLIAKYGLSPSSIIPETNSRDTVGDAYFTKINLAVPRKWQEICVVTSEYHVERTKEVFQFIYGNQFKIDVIGAEVLTTHETVLNEQKSTQAFRRTFAGVESGNSAEIFTRLRTRHPFYNGEIHPQL